MPKVSVVIATRNRAHYLPDAIASILGQSFAEFELLIVDDGSTDATPAVVQAFASPRVHYVRQSHRGVSSARNAGLSIASGEYLAFLDDDDVFLADKLRVQVRELERDTSLGLVAGGHVVIDERQQLLAIDEPWKRLPHLNSDVLLLGNRFSSNSVLIRRSCWDLVRGFDETLTLAEDWHAWLRLALEDCRMAWTRTVVCGVRRHQRHASLDVVPMKEAELEVLRKVSPLANLRWQPERWHSAAVAQVHVRCAARQLVAGRLSCARAELECAVELDSGVLDRASRDILEAIATYASQPFVERPEELVEDAFENLPESAARLRRHRIEVLATVAVDRMFRSYHDGDWRLARNYAAEAMRLAPAYLGNRGVAKVAILSTLHSLGL